MNDFREGDRVLEKETKMTGEVISSYADDDYVSIKFDDRTLGEFRVDKLEKAT